MSACCLYNSNSNNNKMTGCSNNSNKNNDMNQVSTVCHYMRKGNFNNGGNGKKGAVKTAKA